MSTLQKTDLSNNTPSLREQEVPMDWIITQDMWGAAKAQALMAGVELDIFSAIYHGKSTCELVARAAGAEAATPHLAARPGEGRCR